MNLDKNYIIETYKREVANNPDKPVTRDQFCKLIPQSQIVKNFGSFNNLKTFVGDRPTRTAFREMRAFERHKSVENLTDFNKEKFSWSDCFISKDDGTRFKNILAFCDMHDLRCDPFYYRMAIQAVKNGNPHIVVLNGDIIDLPEFSKYNTKLSEFRVRDRIKWLHTFLEDIRNAAPDCDIVYVEGNHEYRLIHHILERTPALEELIDLCDFNIRKLLGLDKYRVRYYSRADIGTFTDADIRNELKKNHFIAWDNVVFYHYPEGRTRFGMPGVSGHHHKFQVWPMHNYTYGAFNWIQSGAGSLRHADFSDNTFCWQNGFVDIVLDTQNKRNLIMNYIDCTGEFCYMDGEYYARTEEEKKYISQA